MYDVYVWQTFQSIGHRLLYIICDFGINQVRINQVTEKICMRRYRAVRKESSDDGAWINVIDYSWWKISTPYKDVLHRLKKIWESNHYRDDVIILSVFSSRLCRIKFSIKKNWHCIFHYNNMDIRKINYKNYSRQEKTKISDALDLIHVFCFSFLVFDFKFEMIWDIMDWLRSGR